jgi:NADH pyrophosphatase NudC (nudix superfamily)
MIDTPKFIYKTALAVFKDKKMIMVRNNRNDEVFFTLGGKIEPGESEIDSLHREIKEEVNAEIKQGSVKLLHEFEAPAFGMDNTIINIKLYSGELVGEPTPSSEIVEIQYFDTTTDTKHLTALTIDVFAWLKAYDYIN